MKKTREKAIILLLVAFLTVMLAGIIFPASACSGECCRKLFACFGRFTKGQDLPRERVSCEKERLQLAGNTDCRNDRRGSARLRVPTLRNDKAVKSDEY